MAPPRIADQLGRVLGGRFRLVAPLGTGASAHVYVAEDVTLRRRVAVKVLHPALAKDETFLRRFRSEAQAVAALRHPHLLQLFDWGEDDDGPYLVLEYLPGGSLRDLLDRGELLTPSQALLLGLHVAEALAHAHRRGLVHRDVKPANLLFDEEGRVVVADFGLARALAEAAWTEPAGAIVGTARYSSPEQARGSRVDGKTDVYSLALVLIEAVTGRVPFASDTTIGTLMARLDRPLEMPEALGAPLADALAGATAIDPAERVDAAELADRLEQAAAALPRPEPLPLVVERREETRPDVTILPPPPPPRLFDDPELAAPGPSGSAAAAPAAARRWPRRLRTALVAVLAAALLAGGVLAAVEATRPSHPVPDLRGLTVAQARNAVADEDFSVRTVDGGHSEETPKGRVLAQSPAPRQQLEEGDTVTLRLSAGPAPRVVPDLAGKTADVAKALVEAQRLVYEQSEAFSDTVERGLVVDWSPKGSQPRDTRVNVVISKGPEPKTLPSLVDRLYEEARKALEELGFLTKRAEDFSDDVGRGKVIATQPDAGTAAQPGDEVTIVVSKGPDTVTVPDVSGMSVADATEKLRSVGLDVNRVDGSPVRTVRGSRPSAGSEVKRGTEVELVTRRD